MGIPVTEPCLNWDLENLYIQNTKDNNNKNIKCFDT